MKNDRQTPDTNSTPSATSMAPPSVSIWRPRRWSQRSDPRARSSPATRATKGIGAATWGYNAQVPGPELRVRAGDVVRARFTDPTSVHWHGIALRNDMDGAAGVTQDAVAPDGMFTYPSPSE